MSKGCDNNNSKLLGGKLLIYWFILFFIYSFFGFLIETIFTYVTKGKIQIRKTLFFLPLCPVYGLGALLMVLTLTPFNNNIIVVALGGAIVGSTAEYLFGILNQRIFNVRIWDYRKEKFNFRGYICLKFTAYWLLLSVLLIYFVQPKFHLIMMFFPKSISISLLFVFTIDLILSSFMLNKIGKGESSLKCNCPVIKQAMLE